MSRGGGQQTPVCCSSLTSGWLLSPDVSSSHRLAASSDSTLQVINMVSTHLPLLKKDLVTLRCQPTRVFCLFICSSAPFLVAIKRNGILFSFDTFSCRQDDDFPDLADNKTLESDSVEWDDKFLQQLALFKEVIDGSWNYNMCEDAFSSPCGAWGWLSQKSSQTLLPCLLGAVRERRNERSNLQMEWKANQYSWCERLWNILWHSAWSLTYVSYSSNCHNVYWAFTLIEKMFQEECTFKIHAWNRSQETHTVRKLVKAFLRKEEESRRVKVLDLEVN